MHTSKMVVGRGQIYCHDEASMSVKEQRETPPPAVAKVIGTILTAEAGNMLQGMRDHSRRIHLYMRMLETWRTPSASSPSCAAP